MSVVLNHLGFVMTKYRIFDNTIQQYIIIVQPLVELLDCYKRFGVEAYITTNNIYIILCKPIFIYITKIIFFIFF